MKHVKHVIVALMMCCFTLIFSQSNLIWTNKFFDPSVTQTNGYYNGTVVDNNGDICVVGEAFNGVNNSVVVGKTSVSGQTLWSSIFTSDVDVKRYLKGGIGVDAQNNIYVTGYQLKDIGNNNNNSDLFVQKISANGVLLWNKIYDSGFNDNMDFSGIIVKPNGEVIIAGMQYNSLNPNYNDLLFVKYDASGNMLWDETVDGGNYEYLRSITTDTNDNIYAAFQIYNYNEVSPNSIGAVKLNDKGEKKWYQVFPWENTIYLYSNLNDLAVNDKGEVFIIGYQKSSPTSNYDLLTVKYDSAGNKLWHKIFDSGNTDYCASVVADKKGNVLVTCNSVDATTGGYYWNVLKYDAAGNTSWTAPVFKTNVMGSFSWNYDMTKDEDGNTFLVGFGFSGGVLVAKSAQVNGDGTVEWIQEFKDATAPGVSYVYGYDVVVDRGAAYIFGASSHPSGTPKMELFVAKYPVIKKIVDVTPPVVIAKNITVTLSNGAVEISAQQINDGSSDVSGIDTMFISVNHFSCSNIGENKVVLTAIDIFGNIAKDTAVVTVLGAIPALNISQGEQSKYCQGGAVVLTANSNTATSYIWNDGDVSKCKSVYASGSYSLTVNNKYGCLAKASTNVVYNPSNLLSAYTILAAENIVLTPNVKVLNGGVGSKGCGQVVVNAGSTVTAVNSFVRAKKIVYSSGAISNPIFSATTVAYPAFLGNTFCNGKNKNIAANAEVTISDSVFGNISIGNNAKVIFTSKNVYAKNMELGKNVRVEFSQCANVRLSGNLSTESGCNINISQSKSILFFVAGNVEISNNNKLRAGVFAKGNIQSTGSEKKQNYLTGMFISLGGIAAHNTIFDREEMCNSCFSSSYKTADSEEEPVEMNTNESITFEAYPNPAVNNSNISYLSAVDKQISVSIYDAKGIELLNVYKGEIVMNQLYNFSFDTSTFASGFYFCKITSSDGEVLTKKLTVER